jgi:NTE family protein
MIGWEKGMQTERLANQEHATKRITLALQGGGSHGAFTWGVLDRLLEEPALEIEAISGTSAGAMNGAVLAYGLMVGGPDAAKRSLNEFWRSVSEAGESVFNPSRYLRDWPVVKSLVPIWDDVLSHFWSPYDNPLYRNLLEPLLAAAIDFERLRRGEKPKLFVCATNVKTNERKIFEPAELSLNALLASACLPSLFQAVEVDGEYYWDGGYLGNPALAPLLEFCQDILIVEVNPLHRHEVPMRASDILDRLNEITFNAALVQEINVINTMNKMIENGNLVNTRYKPIRFHAIDAEREMSGLGVSSKTNTDWGFLRRLHTWGRKSAEAWLKDSGGFANVGICASCDVDAKFVKRTYRDTQGKRAPRSATG